MKPLIVLARIAIVGILWSIFFIEGIRVMLLINWHFDIFNGEHWAIAYNLWMDGWTIRHSKEWAFVLIIVSFIPLWLTGWAALSLINWEKYLKRAIQYPMYWLNQILNRPVATLKTNIATKTVKPKPSYKQIRPRSTRAVATDDYTEMSVTPTVLQPSAPVASSKPAAAPAAAPSTTVSLPITPAAAAATAPASTSKEFDHSLFKFDNDEEDFSFDIDSFDEKPEPKVEEPPVYVAPKPQQRTPKDNASQPKERGSSPKSDQSRKTQTQKPAQKVKAGGNSVLDAIKQKGYEVITSATIKDVLVDFIGLSSKELHLFLVDKEPGDWLADEERFNDEEPLWFSESSHRISPVRKVDIVRTAVQAKLKEHDLRYNVKAHVIIALGNIINAEDMFEVWSQMNIDVTRIDRGSPKELKLLTKSLPEAIDNINKDKLEKLKKLIRNF